MKPIVTLESLLLKSANGEECIQELSDFNDSVYRQEFTVEKLEKQLGILVDVIHVELPEVKKAWPEIADMNDLNSVIRVIKKLYRMSMENFQQSLTLLCGSLLATFVDV